MSIATPGMDALLRALIAVREARRFEPPGPLVAYRVQPWPRGRGYTRYRARNACHRNSWMLVCEHRDLILAKGYALMADLDMWVGHWWCVDQDGGVVDPTWKNDGRAYVGVEVVDTAAFAAEVRRRGMFEVGLPNVAPHTMEAALERASERQIAGPQGEPAGLRVIDGGLID